MNDFKVFIKRLIQGADNVYFRDVIESATGKKILPVSPELKKELLKMKKCFSGNLKGISKHVEKNYTGRANELSNYLEPIISSEINKLKNFKAIKPVLAGGKTQTAGYPDLFISVGAFKFYLEVKTFQLKTKDSSLRTFYYQPSENSKVTISCPHLLIGFEVESKGESNRSPFIIKNFKIIDLYRLKVNLKPEFNASNIELYACREI